MNYLYLTITIALMACAQPQDFTRLGCMTDSECSCIENCLDAMPEPQECSDNFESARIGDTIILSIKEGE